MQGFQLTKHCVFNMLISKTKKECYIQLKKQ